MKYVDPQHTPGTRLRSCVQDPLALSESESRQPMGLIHGCGAPEVRLVCTVFSSSQRRRRTPLLAWYEGANVDSSLRGLDESLDAMETFPMFST